MKFFLILCLSIVFALTSCNRITNQNVDNKDNNTSNLMCYTNYLDIYHYKSGYNIKVSNISFSNPLLCEVYLWPDTIEVPEELKDKTVIRTPVKSVIAFSSTQWSVFQELGEINRVKGILESNYTGNVEILNLIKEKKILDVGIETHIDTEKVIYLQPDIILYTPYPTVQYKDLGKLTGAVMFPFSDYLENHPLGRAEWMKVIGLLCGREKETEEWFNKVANRYESLKTLCAKVKERPVVFSDLPFEGQWYIPGGESYIAKIFEDAGADYVWKDNKSTASVPIDAESVLAKAKNADYWRIMNSNDYPYTYKLLEKENPLYKLFKAFQKKQLLVCNVKQSGYFEHSQYQPDILLADFVYFFHPELLDGEWKEYETRYFKILKE